MRLNDEQRRSIYVGFLTDEPKGSIARRLTIDRSIVRYHINKVRNLPKSKIYALIRPHDACQHTALRCLVCEKAHDNMKHEEFQEIKRLRFEVTRLETLLASHDEIHNRPSRAYPPPPIFSTRIQ